MPATAPDRPGLMRLARALPPACFILATLAAPALAQDAPTPALSSPAPTTSTAPLLPTQSQENPAAAAAEANPSPAAGNALSNAGQADAAPLSQPTLPATEIAPEQASPAPDRASATLPHDLSPFGMFMAADYIVKAVMLGLAFASLVTWTIWLAKALELAMARRRAGRALKRLEAAQGLGEITGDSDAAWPRRGPVAALAAAAALEIARSQHLPADGVKERVQIALQRIEARAGRSMSRGTGLLATIGSTAPFVGLFGTVWGIMNAFIGISKANTTNLAVVAPGIAEALLATAIGLVAAIPAVIIYNVFARSIAGYRAVLADASAEVLRHLSRDLDRRQRFVAAERRQAAE